MASLTNFGHLPAATTPKRLTDVLTGRQIVQARRMLRWSLPRTAAVAGIRIDKLLLAQASENGDSGDPRIDAALRRAFEAAGVQFGMDGYVPTAELGVRRRVGSAVGSA